MTDIRPKRDLSLIERAATVYDFSAHLRAAVPAELLQGEVVSRSPEPATPAMQGGLDILTTARAELVEARPAPNPENALRQAQGEREWVGWTSTDQPASNVPSTPPANPPSFTPRTDGARVEAVDRARLAQKGMIVPGAPIGSLAEEFRLVKRQLLLTAEKLPGARARTILVGSAKPGDGKTYNAINLALSIAAERDVEVLLIDADFAKPDVMAELGLDEGPGLLDILADDRLDPEALVVRTDVPHLSLLPVGAKTHSDTELLASRRTAEVIERLLAADPRRIIIFDSPPALAASPASVLALHVGQVMLVVRADRTTEGDVRQAVSLLDGCEHIQLVLNAVSFVPGGNRFGSYYGQGV